MVVIGIVIISACFQSLDRCTFRTSAMSTNLAENRFNKQSYLLLWFLLSTAPCRLLTNVLLGMQVRWVLPADGAAGHVCDTLNLKWINVRFTLELYKIETFNFCFTFWSILYSTPHRSYLISSIFLFCYIPLYFVLMPKLKVLHYIHLYITAWQAFNDYHTSSQLFRN